jgi:hypothetical protein
MELGSATVNIVNESVHPATKVYVDSGIPHQNRCKVVVRNRL